MKLCDFPKCENPSCGKKIVIQDYGPHGKWMAEVCQKHYNSAHPSRKNRKTMKSKKRLEQKEIDAIRILSGHLRDIDCFQKPKEIKADLHNIAEQLYNLTLK